jgi:hypothetical protein
MVFRVLKKLMNKAFLVIWIPAFATCFYWLYEGYSLRAAIFGTIAMIAAAAGVIVYMRQREKPAAPRPQKQ